jgi:hypothetical protein
MKGNWGAKGTTPIRYPSWAILSLDHMGRVKLPCCIGSLDNKALQPICEDYGLGWYSVLVQMAFQVHSNTQHIAIALLRMLNTNISSRSCY